MKLLNELLNIQYFLFFLLVCTRINWKVFQRVSNPHTVVHLRSMDFPNLVHTLVAMSWMVIAKASRTGNCKRLNSKDISVEIIGMRGNSTSFPLNFPFKIVASMILFIIFFTGHLVTWSLGHLVTWSLGHLVTWSLGHLVTWSLGHLVTGNLVTLSLGHLVIW
jgi:hypothetical protein